MLLGAAAAFAAAALTACFWDDEPAAVDPTTITFAAPTYGDFRQFARGEPKSIDKVPARRWKEFIALISSPRLPSGLK